MSRPGPAGWTGGSPPGLGVTRFAARGSTRLTYEAIGVGATHLLTGDFRHFGPYYGKRIEGFLVLSSGEYLTSRTG